MPTAMNEAEKLAQWMEEMANIPPVSPPHSVTRRTAALLRRQAEQIKVLRLALERVIEMTAEENANQGDPSTDDARITAACDALAATKEET